jgi:hypothetical protein
MAIADFVLAYTQAQEGLYSSVRNYRSAWNVYDTITGVKSKVA